MIKLKINYLHHFQRLHQILTTTIFNVYGELLHDSIAYHFIKIDNKTIYTCISKGSNNVFLIFNFFTQGTA